MQNQIRWHGVVLVVVFLAGSVVAGVFERVGGGNISVRGEPDRFAVLRQLGAGMCRVPVSPRDYWKDGRATPEKADDAVLMAHQSGVRPVLLFEYYTRWGDELGGREKWYEIGRRFAERFAPGSEWLKSQGIAGWGVTFYSAINEPMWKDNNPVPIPPEKYAAALEGLAEGVHSVGTGLRVSPGGYQEVPLFMNRNPYVKAVAPLFNAGKLHALDIHRYWDVDYVPMDKGYRWSLQNQFEEVKRNAGITNNIAFYTTEVNFKKRKVTEEEAARGFLTALWDALTVTGNQGEIVSEFVMPWNIFHLAGQDEHYGLCTRLQPWEPTARGVVLRNVSKLTREMRVLSTDPKETGVTILSGPGRKLWVWQNLKGWSTRYGTSFTLSNIPSAARRIEVHAWDGLQQTIQLKGQISLRLSELPSDQTVMILVSDSTE